MIKLSLDEGAARFWTVLCGGITALALILGGVYSLVQYSNGKAKDQENVQLQLATASLAAKQSYNAKHLELCAQAAGAAATIASSKDEAKRRLAEDEFWQLYWGPLGIVEQSDVAKAMDAFGKCLREKCENTLTKLALAIAQACGAEVLKDFELKAPRIRSD